MRKPNNLVQLGKQFCHGDCQSIVRMYTKDKTKKVYVYEVYEITQSVQFESNNIDICFIEVWLNWLWPSIKLNLSERLNKYKFFVQTVLLPIF